ncbi:inositol 1,4,5-triphosphate receptor associated 2 isoform X1 [Anguilla anguilla]|uniref:inositol 1,4,5-triphosphate receptor associated 2 isoform X1 n=2 Tax=Anguilla anguilla TaxID=7936 RepID=UPI0015AFCE78|nr:inositol 1,4,5-triphosphate receptor associated 2 isoform X1 [Anguilla anguilla]
MESEFSMTFPPSRSCVVLQRSRSLSSFPCLTSHDLGIPECTAPSSSQGYSNEPDGLRMVETPKTTPPGEPGLNHCTGIQEAGYLSTGAGSGWTPCPVQEPSRCAMSNQPAEETVRTSERGGQPEDSEVDSEQELSQEDLLVASWDELSILDRLGFNSVEMTEDEVEGAFSQLALAFRCDQYTLKKRLQAEEHARNLAEENVHLELQRGREVLQSLKALCLDSKRSKMLQRLELCLSILGGTVERIANTAELLGAVHQEARMSRAVDLMVAHVENLKRRQVRDRAELEETRKQLQRCSRSRQLSDPRDESEMRQKRSKTSQQASRRRISIAVISKQPKAQGTELSLLDIIKPSTAAPSQPPLERESLSGRPHMSTKEDLSVNSPLQTPAEVSHISQTIHPTPSPEERGEPLYLHSPQDPLRQRRGQNRGVGQSNPEEKKEAEPQREHELNRCDECADDSCTLRSTQRPLPPWLSQGHLILFWLYGMTISFMILLGIFFWCMQGPLL